MFFTQLNHIAHWSLPAERKQFHKLIFVCFLMIGTAFFLWVSDQALTVFYAMPYP